MTAWLLFACIAALWSCSLYAAVRLVLWIFP